MENNIFNVYSLGYTSKGEPMLQVLGSPHITGFNLVELVKHFKEMVAAQNTFPQYKDAEIVFPREPKVIFSETVVKHAINLYPLSKNEYQRFMKMMETRP